MVRSAFAARVARVSGFWEMLLMPLCTELAVPCELF